MADPFKMRQLVNYLNVRVVFKREKVCSVSFLAQLLLQILGVHQSHTFVKGGLEGASVVRPRKDEGSEPKL